MKTLLLTILLCLTLGVKAQYNTDSTYYTYKNAQYEVQVGPKGGKYILIEGEKYYPSNSKIYVLETQEFVEYQGTIYVINTGTKGGRYIWYNGKKRYLTLISKSN